MVPDPSSSHFHNHRGSPGKYEGLKEKLTALEEILLAQELTAESQGSVHSVKLSGEAKAQMKNVGGRFPLCWKKAENVCALDQVLEFGEIWSECL